ncbi:MAG: squalene synthase HpnC [Jatrophihabitantaceae bacterium]
MSGIDPAQSRGGSELEWVAARAAAQMGTENFPVALRMLPRRPRTHLARVYAFARFVDDVGDEASGDRLALLDLIERDVRALWGGEPTLGPVLGLRSVLDDCSLPIEPLLDLIEANRIDQRTMGYDTIDELLGYCRLSAAPVGRIVLQIAGAVTQRNVADSDAVCAALQILEHCQDVDEDAHAGRIYLPRADLRHEQVRDADLLTGVTNPGLRQVIALNVDRAEVQLAAGAGLVGRLSGWARCAVGGYVAGGLATVAALRRADYDVLAHEIRPSRLRTATCALRLVAPW